MAWRMGLLHSALLSWRSLFCSSSGGWLRPLSGYLSPFSFSSEGILLIQGASELIGPERIMTLIGILAGVR